MQEASCVTPACERQGQRWESRWHMEGCWVRACLGNKVLATDVVPGPPKPGRSIVAHKYDRLSCGLLQNGFGDPLSAVTHVRHPIHCRCQGVEGGISLERW